ncbi:MAG: KilA-N domain-containing protein [Cyanobacteria bacterium J06648_1]
MKMIIHQANGLQIGQRIKDGYINATALSKAHYKATNIRRDTNHWLALERTKKTIEHLARLTEISVDQLVIKIRTGKNEHRGTYIHPRLAVRFGIWLSDDFGYMVEEWVSQWMTTGKNPIQRSQTTANATIKNKPDALQLLDQIQYQINHARLFRHTAHNITDQPIFSKNILDDTVVVGLKKSVGVLT